MELIYDNSQSKGMVDIAYLAIDDKMLVNKMYLDSDGVYTKTYSHYDNELWLRFESKDKESNTMMTLLLTYDDTDEWDTSLMKELTNLHNEELFEELYDNEYTMIFDAIFACGFNDTYIGDMIEKSIQENAIVFSRECDFMMWLPSKNELHPLYDT
jgi:allophanate hydrolase subunit 1